MRVKYGVMGACTGLVFAIVIVLFAARWNETRMPETVITDARGR